MGCTPRRLWFMKNERRKSNYVGFPSFCNLSMSFQIVSRESSMLSCSEEFKTPRRSSIARQAVRRSLSKSSSP